MDELRHLVNEYRKIESNLNQIAKYFNTGGESSSDYMDKPHEHEAGFKHRSTTRFLNYLKKEVIKMCNREGLRQVNLLSPAPAKITRWEYWAKTHGQEQMNQVNEKIHAAGLKPTSSVFQTQKQFLRNAIDGYSQLSGSFDEFQSLLLDKYNISVVAKCDIAA